uniref:Ankyrin repeat protein n=1 Tax=viral metagenome TaxID=1070528 RepID=A0A6C0J9G5_9ZZZZ
MSLKIINACKLDSISSLKKCNLIKDMWGRHPLYYAVINNSYLNILWLYQKGHDLYQINTIKGNKEDLITTALRTKNIYTIKTVCDLWERPINPSLYFTRLLMKSQGSEELEYFLSRFKIFTIKGLERLICKKAKVKHYKIFHRLHICFSLLESLRYCLTYRRNQEFLYLVNYIRCPEQLNAIFTTGGHSTINLLSIAIVTVNIKASKILLKHGTNPSILISNSNRESMTSLHVIANTIFKTEEISSIEYIIRLLLCYIDINKTNAEGLTAYEFAKYKNNKIIISLFDKIN